MSKRVTLVFILMVLLGIVSGWVFAYLYHYTIVGTEYSLLVGAGVSWFLTCLAIVCFESKYDAVYRYSFDTPHELVIAAAIAFAISHRYDGDGCHVEIGDHVPHYNEVRKGWKVRLNCRTRTGPLVVETLMVYSERDLFFTD